MKFVSLNGSSSAFTLSESVCEERGGKSCSNNDNNDPDQGSQCRPAPHQGSPQTRQGGGSLPDTSGQHPKVLDSNTATITISILISVQDYHYFPYKHHSMMAIFVHLDDTDPSNGGLGVFPGSHLKGPQVKKFFSFLNVAFK